LQKRTEKDRATVAADDSSTIGETGESRFGSMKRGQAIAALAIAAAFICGLAVGDWRPGIAKTFKGWFCSSKGNFYESEGPYYRSKVFLFQQLSGTAEVVMVGDSITEGIDWQELFPKVKMLNRGINGDTSKGVLDRLNEIIDRRPRVVFLMIGINDLRSGMQASAVAANIRLIVDTLRRESIRLVLQSTLYVTADYNAPLNDRVNELNRLLADFRAPGVFCLDLNARLAEHGALSSRFSFDGLHLNAAGYLIWKSEINLHVMELSSR
jgi:lysophospholipase L1-like esterase